MEAVEKLGYQPDILARGMITGMLPMVLVIVGDIQNHYFTQALAGIETTLEEQGFMVVVFDSSYDPERIVTSIHMAKTWPLCWNYPYDRIWQQTGHFHLTGLRLSSDIVKLS